MKTFRKFLQKQENKPNLQSWKVFEGLRRPWRSQAFRVLPKFSTWSLTFFNLHGRPPSPPETFELEFMGGSSGVAPPIKRDKCSILKQFYVIFGILTSWFPGQCNAISKLHKFSILSFGISFKIFNGYLFSGEFKEIWEYLIEIGEP